MLIKIESFYGDSLLSGKVSSIGQLKYERFILFFLLLDRTSLIDICASSLGLRMFGDQPRCK